MVLRRFRLWTAAPSRRRRCFLKRKSKAKASARAASARKKRRADASPKAELPDGGGPSEVLQRNIALEAVRVGNYYSEDQEEVLQYILEVHAGLLADQEWLRKNAKKLQKENGLTRRYTWEEILRKKHESDGFDVFVDPDEAVFMAEREKGELARPKLSKLEAEEIQEGLDSVVASTSAAPLSVEEVFELLERCVTGGEVAAAVYLAGHLEARQESEPSEKWVEKLFQALKTLLRPSAHAASPKLAGPWLQAPAGRYGALNPRKSLGRFFERLAKRRAKPQDNSLHEVNEALQRLSKSLLPALLSDERAQSCRRRGPMVATISALAQEGGLAVSPALAQAIFQQLEQDGILEVKGRDVTLQKDQSVRSEAHQISSLHAHFYTDVPMLEAFAKKRLERRKQRQQAREATKRRKKQT